MMKDSRERAMRLLAGVLCLTLGVSSLAFADTVRLSPKMRVSQPKVGKPIAGKEIMPFLQHLYILSEKEYDALPGAKKTDIESSFIEEGEAFLIDRLPEDVSKFDIISKENALVDTRTSKKYGLVANKIGEARLEHSSNGVYKLRVTNLEAPMFEGMKVIPEQEFNLPKTVYAYKPGVPHIGRVISLTNQLEMEGIYQTAILNIGANQGISQGCLLSVYTRFNSSSVKKRPWQAGGNEKLSTAEEVQPSEFEDPIGEVMVYKTLDNVSLAIITESKQAITINDMVVTNGHN